MDDTVRGTRDTRAQIQRVALELFTENGYDKTSLREIAERLGVTKAALYYHFRSKEELVESFLDDRLASTDELLAWLADQPPSLAVRQEFLRRYVGELASPRHAEVIRFFEANQAALRGTRIGERMRERLLTLVNLMVDREAPLTEQIRSALAIWAVHTTWFVIRDPEVTDAQRREAALEVALDLLTRAADAD